MNTREDSRKPSLVNFLRTSTKRKYKRNASADDIFDGKDDGSDPLKMVCSNENYPSTPKMDDSVFADKFIPKTPVKSNRSPLVGCNRSGNRSRRKSENSGLLKKLIEYSETQKAKRRSMEDNIENLIKDCPTPDVTKTPENSSNELIKETGRIETVSSFEKRLLESGFAEKYLEASTLPLKKYKEVDETKETKAIRNKACRSTMQGHSCDCCKDYYNALNLSTPEKEKRINEVSRHRGIYFKCDKTPEGYWDKNFLTKSAQKRKGLLIETTSPLIKNKKPKRKLVFKDDVVTCKDEKHV
uniref:SAE2 domain-containing protein n=1 Tax=Parastrongyloides trichosuri TaxID=131310 RepID=A0A0N4ZJ79_PARTI